MAEADNLQKEVELRLLGVERVGNHSRRHKHRDLGRAGSHCDTAGTLAHDGANSKPDISGMVQVSPHNIRHPPLRRNKA